MTDENGSDKGNVRYVRFPQKGKPAESEVLPPETAIELIGSAFKKGMENEHIPAHHLPHALYIALVSSDYGLAQEIVTKLSSHKSVNGVEKEVFKKYLEKAKEELELEIEERDNESLVPLIRLLSMKKDVENVLESFSAEQRKETSTESPRREVVEEELKKISATYPLEVTTFNQETDTQLAKEFVRILQYKLLPEEVLSQKEKQELDMRVLEVFLPIIRSYETARTSYTDFFTETLTTAMRQKDTERVEELSTLLEQTTAWETGYSFTLARFFESLGRSFSQKTAELESLGSPHARILEKTWEQLFFTIDYIERGGTPLPTKEFIEFMRQRLSLPYSKKLLEDPTNHALHVLYTLYGSDVRLDSLNKKILANQLGQWYEETKKMKNAGVKFDLLVYIGGRAFQSDAKALFEKVRKHLDDVLLNENSLDAQRAYLHLHLETGTPIPETILENGEISWNTLSEVAFYYADASLLLQADQKLQEYLQARGATDWEEVLKHYERMGKSLKESKLPSNRK